MEIPIVGIGASAGGLEALSELLGALQAPCDAALIIVQHLDRTHESLLTEILGRKAALPVVEAQEGVVVEANRAYVIPPNATLTVSESRLHLAPRGHGRGPHMPVDALFRSLAQDRGERAMSVVLSGADSDGALGTQSIKLGGGITFAQRPDTARIASMPRSAIETGCVDFVLRPSEIASELTRLVAHPYLLNSRASAVLEEAHSASLREEPDLAPIFRHLRSVHGVDFTRYKSSTLRRRLARRMALHRTHDLADYVAFLEGDVVETAGLYQDFLIRVTGFFRDPESFVTLTERVFPSLCAGRSSKEPIRIWVPGCASGEEVYSIAIALVEFLGEPLPAYGVQIFGTDVSEVAIEKARAGLYLDAIAQDVSPERLQRYFTKQDSHYCIARNIRDLCIFARQDVTRDPPFSRLDLVSCRNLLIYLGAAAQQRVMQIFHYALRPSGFLLLGPAESVGHGSEYFEQTGKSQRLYARRTTGSGGWLEAGRATAGVSASGSQSDSADGAADRFPEADSALRQADRLLLARYAPAGILVDEALNILQFRGETGPYLTPASGPPSLNLQRVARPELLADISAAIHEARASGTVARHPGLKIDGVGEVDMEVIQLPQKGQAPCYLILFEDESCRVSVRRARQVQRAALTDLEKDQQLAQLERENADLRDFLQATMEQHEAAQEELKSANEEVLSANEEFQSTNEELETSQEELQSTNEELTTTNDELRDRNRQLGALNTELENARAASERARAYADGIVETVREPLVVLDAELCILRANHAFYSDFILVPQNVEGHSLFDVIAGQWDGNLREKLAVVLRQNQPMSDFEVSFVQSTGHRRVLALNARKIPGDVKRIGLILLAIEDITDQRASTDLLREDARRKDEFLAMLAHELRNPLGPITHAVHLLRRGQGKAPELHAMIERQTARLVRLVDDLLDVARINRGLIELKRVPIDLSPVVRQAVEANQRRVDQRQQVLTMVLPEAPVSIEGDVVRLEQVISNLLENAVKYTDPGGRIAVTLREANGAAVLSVSDNGIGLGPETLEHIFDLFVQVDRSLARSGGGLGLGLTVVRRVLEMHGGHIEARSEGLGRGSEFVGSIPLLAVSHLQKREERIDLPGDNERRRRVLIVDDNSDLVESMALLIRSWGHEVGIAHDAKDALAVAAAFRPETVLIDIGLPDMSGYELARRLRADPVRHDVQLVAITGYGRAEDRTAAHDAGFDVHLVKPAQPEELARVLAARKAIQI